MRRFRLLLAWLVMAAIPFQGFAAATMLFCHGAPGAAQVHAAGQVFPAAAAVQHDHSVHGHGAQLKTVKMAKAASDSAGEVNAGHKCGVCASCCHVVAISESSAHMQFVPLPQADAAAPFVLIHARPAPVPDKPPRA